MSSEQEISCTISCESNQWQGERIIIKIIIIIPLFILGNIYSTYAIGAEQMIKTNNSNQT